MDSETKTTIIATEHTRKRELRDILFGEKAQIPPCINAYSEKLPKFAFVGARSARQKGKNADNADGTDLAD